MCELDWPAQSPDLKPIQHLLGWTGTPTVSQELIAQNLCPTSCVMLLWPNESKSLQTRLQISWKAFTEEERRLLQQHVKGQRTFWECSVILVKERNIMHKQQSLTWTGLIIMLTLTVCSRSTHNTDEFVFSCWLCVTLCDKQEQPNVSLSLSHVL